MIAATTLRALRAALLLASASGAAAQTAIEPPPLDLVLSGGTVLDGTGAPGARADVGIRAGRIEAVGDLASRSAARRIDVGGLVVAPGFIDTHAHADAVVLRRPEATNFVAMGVTTIVTGNCGNSMRDLGRHLAAVAKRRPGVNYASLIGHNTVRTAAMGSANRAPTPAELARMKDLVAEAMAAGALGLSTGLIYVPGTYAATEELIELAGVAGRHGGLYASHMRNEGEGVLDAIDEALRIGREAGLPVHLSHLKASGRPSWGRGAAIIERIRAARARGQRVTGDQYAYTASSTGLDVLFPSSALDVGREEFARRLAEDEVFRKRMHAALLDTMDAAGFGDFSYCQVSWARNNDDASGKTLKEVAEAFFDRSDRDAQADAAIKLFADSRGTARVNMVYHKMSEADVITIMQAPFVGVACDAGIRTPAGVDKPHPRGTGNNARVLGYFVREKQALPLPLAVHKMTGLPARVFGLRGRGTIAPGAHADLCVFDPRTVADRATYAEPRRSPAGIPLVLVNGVPVIEDGEPTGARPGVVIRRAPRAVVR